MNPFSSQELFEQTVQKKVYPKYVEYSSGYGLRIFLYQAYELLETFKSVHLSADIKLAVC